MQVAALLGAVVLAFTLGQGSQWRPTAFVAIAAFCVISDLTAIPAAQRFWISGSFLGVVLMSVTMGGGPAALLGVISIGFGWLRSREPGHHLRSNLVNFAVFPVLTAVVFNSAVSGFHVARNGVDFYLLVFAAFMVGLSLNFSWGAIYMGYLNRRPFLPQVREVFLPVLPAELASALITVGGVFVYRKLGAPGLILCGLVFVIFQYLVGEMLKSKRRSIALRRAATTDDLTGLPNRERFREVVERRIKDARASDGRLAVMLMDLDHFKEINDALGHHYGDGLLRDLGPRLVDVMGEGGVVARLGGDEFGLLLGEDTDDADALGAVLEQLFRRLAEPFAVDGLTLEIGASVGVACYPRDGDDAHALLRCADIAMYSAKEAQADYRIYTSEQNRHSAQRLSVLSDIRHAIGNDEIVVHFQPIVDLETRSVRGAEGLVRWQHPEHGLIPPGAFVQTVEQNGLIGPLTRHVLEQAIAQCAEWRRTGNDLSVAVNLSVRNLLDLNLPQQVERLLTSYGLPAEALQLEITESMIMSDPERAAATVTRLSELGVRMSVDDFGTGYSSLAKLRNLPLNELKIDRSFVGPMLQDESDLIIVRSTINLGHDLGLQIIAEGVEDSATLERLAVLGCDLAQGYHVSRPLPAPAFDEWLVEWTAEDDETPTSGIILPAGTGR